MMKENIGFRLETCVGALGCPNRVITGQGQGEEIKALLQERDWQTFFRNIVPGPVKSHHEFRVSISDCPNACSQPQIADIGLIGASPPVFCPGLCNRCGACSKACHEGAISFPAGASGVPCVDPARCVACGKCTDVSCPGNVVRKGKAGYRILLGGKLGRHPKLATELPALLAPEEILTCIECCADYYMAHCRRGERLGELLEVKGIDEIARIIMA